VPLSRRGKWSSVVIKLGLRVLITKTGVHFPFNAIAIREARLEVERKRIGPDITTENLLNVVTQTKIKLTNVRIVLMTEITDRSFILSDKHKVVPGKLSKHDHEENNQN